MGETSQLMPVLGGLALFYSVRAEYQAAREMGEQLLSLAQRVQDPVCLMEAQWVLGTTSFFPGDFAAAREYLEQGIALYDRHPHRRHIILLGQDLGVLFLVWFSHPLWHLGYPNQALQRTQEALALAQERAHPFSLAFALDYAAMLHQFRQESRAAQERAEDAIALCTEYGFAYYLAWATIIRGWALTEQGQGEEGLAQMHQGVSDLRDTGGEVRLPYYLALLAEAYGKAGQIEAGLALLAEALAQAHNKGEYWREAELHRLKGTLLLALSTDNHAETATCFSRAISIARRQQAKSLELRATMSLSHLWQRQGKSTEARALLAPIYSWFTEGFDTADLQEAKALLETLA
jgi:adenylate cyclase